MRPTPTPLEDDALQRFLRDGYITLDAGLPADFHRGLFEEVDGLFEGEGNPGNNILPRVPAIRRVLDSPAVHGAMQSLLGTTTTCTLTASATTGSPTARPSSCTRTAGRGTTTAPAGAWPSTTRRTPPRRWAPRESCRGPSTSTRRPTPPARSPWPAAPAR